MSHASQVAGTGRSGLRRRAVACALLAALAGACWAQECRIAFDLGSSGIRAGTNLADGRSQSVRRELDVLTPLWAGQGLRSQEPAIAAALTELPRQAGWPDRCIRAGAGFSAWRLAWQQEGAHLIDVLAQLKSDTGVAVLVVPQAIEARLGYRSAQAALGPGLTTSHVLDLGGGSMQVAGESSSFGADLGQKTWLQKLCKQLGRDTRPTCTLAPLSAETLTQARSLAREELKDLPGQLGPGVSLTAITRPITRGVLPALKAMGHRPKDAIGLDALSSAILALAPLELSAAAQLTGTSPAFVGYLVSDMLLIEALLELTQTKELRVAEADIDYLPALLADERGFAWAQRHACYLGRLAQQGPSAYLSDPATCQER